MKNTLKNNIAKPFVKWAGGKAQLLDQIKRFIPDDLKKKEFVYIEPFVGGGAVLFWILNEYPRIKNAVINDINTDLINTYRTIKNNVFDLIAILKKYEREYHSLENDPERKKAYYYHKRELFNRRNSGLTEQSALFIFLNRTCFNGLYRVNRKNEFNVPIGNYKKPMICDESNLLAVNKLLQKVTILNEDFEETLKYAGGNTLFYLDPPYKPISKTSSFNSYTKDGFDDGEQIRLAKFCEKIDVLGYHWILSNSDVKEINPEDDFFEKLYKKYHIKRVIAKRNINANAKKRGELKELLIINYSYEKANSIT